MADQKNEFVVRIPHAFGTDEHFEKVYEGDTAEQDAHALSTALNEARGKNAALRVDGKIVFPEALANVMVRQVTDFDALLAKAQADQDARAEEARQAREREAEALHTRADALHAAGEGVGDEDADEETRLAHASGATTDAEGAGGSRTAPPETEQ